MRGFKRFLSTGYAESAIAIASFAGSSVYWLGLAFALSPDAYGRLMVMQAAILIVVTGLTFRTHDLFFNLVTHHGHGATGAYRAVFRSEVVAAALATSACIAGASLYAQGDRFLAAGLAGFALLSSVGANQGASIGKLRYLGRGDVIARSDILAGLTWAAACLAVWPLRNGAPVVLLVIGAIPPCVRTLVLVTAAHLTRVPVDSDADGASSSVRVGLTVRFLAQAQVTNFLKNGAVSIETIILGAFASPAVVAMYRIARAIQGASLAALNVSYQRVYPVLARSTASVERHAAIRRLQRNSIVICLVIYPLSALVALIYALSKPDIGVVEFQLVTAATFAALLPVAYQQGHFAILSLAGDHRALSVAYLVSLAVLAATAAVLMAFPRLEIFMMGIIGAGIARLWYMSSKSRRLAGSQFPRT